MKRTAEYVSLGHPDKMADYISSYVLDRFIEQDPRVKYAVEVMVKDNVVVFGGEVTGDVQYSIGTLHTWVYDALAEIGYTAEYAYRWSGMCIDPKKVQVVSFISDQSADIADGVERDGWGDQGVFVGYACKGAGYLPRELFLARKLNNALYDLARHVDNRLGLDIKTQITLNDLDGVETAIVAVPMLQDVDLTEFIIGILGEEPENIIVNGTGIYTFHSSVADCGITGRKLAVDFYSTAAPVGGGSPWTKDASKADVTLNFLARQMAIRELKDSSADEVFVYLSSCIGRADLPSASFKRCFRKNNGQEEWTSGSLVFVQKPSEIIEMLGLNKPVFARLCREGGIGGIKD